MRPSRTKGCFITFEGVDGSGKTTQIDALSQHLREHTIDHLCTREPGGTPLGESLREKLLHHPQTAPLTQALLMAAARHEHVQHVIQPALAKGTWVLSDRFMDSTTVYQGHVQGVDLGFLSTLHQATVGGVIPDITFLITLPMTYLETRLNARHKDHYDDQPLAFHAHIQEGFVALAEKHPQRFCIIDGHQAPDRITQDIWRAIQQRFSLKESS